ncbi:hypothetical protein I203_106249 [Kwoniella mangroviensis CBS 8507]|uniref:uncharacterized protein n=1 Tax=Kwoniella mangroviensis CBS 8507 TaxID=1296122 RepID=UPI0030274894
MKAGVLIPAVLAIQSKSAINNEVNQEALQLGYRIDSVTFPDVTMPLQLVLLGCVKIADGRVTLKLFVALVCPESDQYSVSAAIQELAQLVISQHPKQVLVPSCSGRVVIDHGIDDVKEVLEEMWRMDKHKMSFKYSQERCARVGSGRRSPELIKVETVLDDRKWGTGFLSLLKKAGSENLILILKVCVVGVTGCFRKNSEEGWSLYSVGAVKRVGNCRWVVGFEGDEARVEPSHVMAIRDDEGTTRYACSCSIRSCKQMVAVEFFKLSRDRNEKDADEDMDVDENMINYPSRAKHSIDHPNVHPVCPRH